MRFWRITTPIRSIHVFPMVKVGQRLVGASRLKWRASRISAALGALRPFARFHFSQEGEDIILRRLFEGQANGFFVDVGAHHPFRFSNTYWAYQKGWSGVNIDATPGSSKSFNRWRPRDFNVEFCIGTVERTLDYTIFSEPALNTHDSSRIESLSSLRQNPKGTIQLYTRRLDSILAEVFLENPSPVIDFLSIDVEGSEMDVLESNDWLRFKPRVIVIEILGKTFSTVSGSKEFQFLSNLGFVPVSMLYHSVIFISDKALLTKRWS